MLVLDANILIRGLLGSRFLGLLHDYAEHVDFVAPDMAFEEARESLPLILERRKLPIPPAMSMLMQLGKLVQSVEAEIYQSFELLARQRISRCDEDDWPILATALPLNCAIWTEDTDVFGCGVATWTTDRVELYLTQAAERGQSSMYLRSPRLRVGLECGNRKGAALGFSHGRPFFVC